MALWRLHSPGPALRIQAAGAGSWCRIYNMSCEKRYLNRSMRRCLTWCVLLWSQRKLNVTPIEAVFVPHWDGVIFLWWVDLLELVIYLSCLISRTKKVDEITLTLYRITTALTTIQVSPTSFNSAWRKFAFLRWCVGNCVSVPWEVFSCLPRDHKLAILDIVVQEAQATIHHLLKVFSSYWEAPKPRWSSLRFRAPCWTLWHLEEITGEHPGDGWGDSECHEVLKSDIRVLNQK